MSPDVNNLLHPVIAACFADHVTKRNGGSGDENAMVADVQMP